MERISSRQNAAVKRFRDARGGGGKLALLDGEHLLEEALRSGVSVDVAAFSDRLLEGRLSGLAARAQAAGARVLCVTGPVLAAISPVRQPSGVVALAVRRCVALDAVLDRAPQLALMLDDVQNPGNVGAIVRAAEAFGATGIVTGETTADPWSWKALRGSMGSAFRVPVACRQPLAGAARRAKVRGLRVVTAVPRAGRSPAEADLRQPAALLLGGEGGGLSEELLDLADDRITVPMRDPVESLNVAVAAALILYEASRQRGSHP